MMTERPYKTIGVADMKRRFADVVGDVRYRGRRYVIERNGTPVAALVPLDDLLARHRPDSSRGFLSLIGAFDDAPELPDALETAVSDRGKQRSRPLLHLTK